MAAELDAPNPAAKPLAAFVRGWGARLFDSVGGADLMIKRMQALGIEVIDAEWDHSADTVKKIQARYAPGRQVFLIGVSCGANVLSWIEAELRKLRIPVNYAGWIQPSRWCVSGWMPKIPDNVVEACIIYGSCLKTLLLGCYKPSLEIQPLLVPPDKSLYDGKRRVGNGGKTIVRWMFVDDLHPADFDVRGVQDPLLHDMARIMKSEQKVYQLMARIK